MTTTQTETGFMIEIPIAAKAVAGAGAFAALVGWTAPIVGEVINYASGVSLEVVGAVFTVTLGGIVWILKSDSDAKKRDVEIRTIQRDQNRCMKEMCHAVNRLIDNEFARRVQLFKISAKLDIPGSKETLENLKAIEHVRPPSTL